MGTTGSMAAEDQEGSKCCCKRIERIEVLLQKEWKDRSVSTRDWEDGSFLQKIKVLLQRIEKIEVLFLRIERSKCYCKGSEDQSTTAKDQNIEVLLRRIKRSKHCCKRIKWSCDAEDEDIEENCSSYCWMLKNSYDIYNYFLDMDEYIVS